MNEQKSTSTTTPPGLIASITAGFNSVAANISLILFPVLLDLILWFGPHIRLRALLQPLIDQMNANMPTITNPDLNEYFKVSKDAWQVVLEHFNLASSLHTFPVGIPSLMTATMPIATPLGNPIVFEQTSYTSALLMWVGLSLIGLIAASWYFFAIASKSAQGGEKPNLGNVGAAAFQILFLFVILIFLVLVLLVPFTMIFSIFMIFSPLLAEISLLVMGLFIIWMLVPFIFSPHGIFTHQLSAVKSILVSLRLVRRFLPGTGIFILMLLLMSEGLNMLWRFAPETSWMALVGILGHAFISTALISATFFYYRAGMIWMEEVISRTVNNGIKV